MALDAAASGLRDASQAARLAAFSRVLTDDVDEAADEVGRIFCPHALDPLQKPWPGFHALHNSAAFSGFSVNYVCYGGSVAIDPGCLDRFFLFQTPLHGRAAIKTAGRDIDSIPHVAASLLSPTIPTRMVWQDCAQLIMLIDRDQIEARAAALSERPKAPVEFDPHVDLATPFGRALQIQIEYLVDVVERQGSLSPAALANVRESIIGLLLTGQRHNLSDAIHRPRPHDILPAALKRARDCLEASAELPLDLDRLARMSGLGVRSLQLGFKRHFGVSISDALRDIRLQRLHARLTHAQPGERVVNIGLELGFTHLSRMASDYRARFGDSPSQTLRKAR